MQPGDGRHQAEPQTVAGQMAGPVAAGEALQQRILETAGQAGPGIGDGDLTLLVEAQLDVATGRGEFDGIVEQVGDRFEHRAPARRERSRR